MKRALALLIITTTGFIVPSGAAHASGSPGCVTKGEYHAVKKGMTKAKVAHVFGTSGKRVSIASSGGYAAEIRNYKTCSRYSAVSIAFDKNPGGVFRLSAKSAVWVR